jgi:hypothetical protein
MKWGQTFSLTTLLLLLFTSPLQGSDSKPGWVSHYPVPDSTYYYAVGIGEADNLSTAVAEAEKHAWVSLVQNVLGMSGIARSSVDSTMKGVELRDEIQFTSDVVDLKGLETVGTFSEDLPDGGIRAFVLRRYPKVEANALKNMMGGSGGRLLNRVTIDSVPTAAEILIDGEPYGVTPMQIMLPPRAYKIIARKTGFESVSKRLILISRQDQNLQFELNAQSGDFYLTVSPPSAKVSIDGHFYEPGEAHQFSLPVGLHRLTVEAPGYKRQKRKILVRGKRTLSMDLSLQEEQKPTNPVVSERPRRVASSSWEERCANLVRKNRWPELVEAAAQWATTESNQPNAYYYQGLGYMMLNRLDKSIELLSYSNNMRTDSIVLQTLCDAYSRNYQYNLAYQYCNRSLDLNLKDPYTYVLLGWVLKESGDTDRAYHNFQVAASLKPIWKRELVRFCRSPGVWYLYSNCQRYW